MFRRPSEGQSLISYLSEQDFGSCADLEKVRNQKLMKSSFIGLSGLRVCGAIYLNEVSVHSSNVGVDCSNGKVSKFYLWRTLQGVCIPH
jgi:hypothetical protein